MLSIHPTTKSDLMQVTIYYFAYLREKRGIAVEQKKLLSSVSVGQLFQDIFGMSSQGIRFSINQEFVNPDRLVEAGDEVAFLPPVGGG